MLEVDFLSERLQLLPERAIFWPKQRLLILADFHLGKASHFRRSGIPVPTGVIKKNLERLVELLYKTDPAQVLFLGDLFHSDYNPEWEAFGAIVTNFPQIRFELAIGNHDVLSAYQYERFGIQVFPEIRVKPFVFCHHPVSSLEPEWYPLTGHVHPGVRLNGKGKQGLTLPCFYFGKQQGHLPAFGELTGKVSVRPANGDRIFAITPSMVMECI